jgi:phosphatidylglycerophosphate synthase
MDARFLESQKHRDVLAAYWPRRISPYITALLVKTRVTPNQTTVLWGVISALNSYVIYRVLVGEYQWLPVIPLVYVLTYVLDCVDGEVARVRHMENPVGGKLLDGICHRTTEYSLLAAYVCACATLTNSPWVLPIGLLLISGEAMYTYAYERRLTTMRVDIGFTGLLAQSDSGMYARGERWSNLSLRRKIATIKGQVHYKSVYPIVVLSYVSGSALLGGLALLAAYKHVAWVRLITKTLAAARAAKTPAPTAAWAGTEPATADSLSPTATQL